jgi:hypothetical protein
MVGMYAKKKISAFVKNQIPVKDIVPYWWIYPNSFAK